MGKIADSVLQDKWLGKRVVRDEATRIIDEGISFIGDVGLTDQSQAKDCDVNEILKRFEKTGQLPDMIQADPQYGDFSNAPDYHAAMDICVKAQEQFDALDAHVRKRFGNDPAMFLEFATDPANQEELIKMGLAKVKNGISSNSESSRGSSGDLNRGQGGSQGASKAPSDSVSQSSSLPAPAAGEGPKA